MAEKVINLPTLIAKISAKAGVDLAVTRRFLHELFSTIETQLSQGSVVEVKGLGQFARGMGEKNAVMFKPDAKLADIINEPFSAFTPVELNDGAEEEIIGSAAESDVHNEIPAESEPVPASEPPVYVETGDSEEKEPIADATNEETVAAPAIEPPVYVETGDSEEKEPVAEAANEETVAAPAIEPPVYIEPRHDQDKPGEDSVKEDVATQDEQHVEAAAEVSTFIPPAVAPESPSYAEENNPEPSGQSPVLWILLGVMIGLIIGLVGGYFAGKTMESYELPVDMEDYEDDYGDELQTEEPTDSLPTIGAGLNDVAQASDTVAAPVAAPVATPPQAPAKVTARVKSTLAALAKEHYGHKNWWVFIYQANPQLKHPNLIDPNTEVVIPPTESFAGKTTDETDAKAQSIYNELSKKYKL